MGEAPRTVGHKRVSWRRQSSVLAEFSPYPVPYDADGSARWPFSRLGFRGVRGWRAAWKRGTTGG